MSNIFQNIQNAYCESLLQLSALLKMFSIMIPFVCYGNKGLKYYKNKLSIFLLKLLFLFLYKKCSWKLNITGRCVDFKLLLLTEKKKIKLGLFLDHSVFFCSNEDIKIYCHDYILHMYMYYTVSVYACTLIYYILACTLVLITLDNL